MTVWNVSPIYYGEDKVRYTVLPYNLLGVMKTYLKAPHSFRNIIIFLKNSRLSEKSARKYAEYKMKPADIKW